MKRRAIIIGSPLSGKDFLPGVKHDVNNYYKFLQSDIGGAYRDSEIKYLVHPNAESLMRLILSIVDLDIVTVYFSGHGFRNDGYDYICINEHQHFPVVNLLTQAKRNLLIIDACRVGYEWEEFSGIGDIGFHFTRKYPDLARSIYKRQLLRSPLGSTATFSCSPSQYSLDSRDGGVYSLSMMTTVKDWAMSNKGSVLSVKEAFDGSIENLGHQIIEQTPVFRTTNPLAVNIPFAVNPESYLRQVQIKSQHFAWSANYF